MLSRLEDICLGGGCAKILSQQPLGRVPFGQSYQKLIESNAKIIVLVEKQVQLVGETSISIIRVIDIGRVFPNELKPKLSFKVGK
jgi:hypothetical protein